MQIRGPRSLFTIKRRNNTYDVTGGTRFSDTRYSDTRFSDTRYSSIETIGLGLGIGIGLGIACVGIAGVGITGTGHWSEGSLVRKLYSRRVRVRVRVRVG